MSDPTIVHLEVPRIADVAPTEYPAFPYEIGPLRFSASEADRADWLAMVQYAAAPLRTAVPRERRIYVVTEPNGNFPDAFINQFGIVISPFAIPGFRGTWVQEHGALPPFFGLGGASPAYDYASLMALSPPAKRKAVSVVVSNKTLLPGHRRRLRFLRELKQALGDQLEVFGRGLRPVAVKADAILPFQYHLALENSQMPFYWTEKVGDAWLGYAFPFVSGAPNLDRWFPRDSFLAIDIGDVDGAIATIRAAMDADIYAQRVDAIRAARDRLMRHERLCQVVARVIAATTSTAPRLASPVTIEPTPKRSTATRVRREVARLFWQIGEKLR